MFFNMVPLEEGAPLIVLSLGKGILNMVPLEEGAPLIVLSLGKGVL